MRFRHYLGPLIIWFVLVHWSITASRDHLAFCGKSQRQHGPRTALPMTPFQHLVTLILLKARLTFAQVACSQLATCGECTADGSECFWCYDHGGTCKTIGQGGSILDGCQNLTFSPGDCQCEPAQKRTCSECTAQLGCVWSNATVTLEYDLPFVGDGSITLPTGTACRMGNGFTGPAILASVGEHISWILLPDSWYWSQCTWEGRLPAITYTAGIVAVFLPAS